MPRIVYWSGVALLVVVGAFLLTDWLLKPPPGLEARCRKMLAMQLRVYNATRTLARALEQNTDSKPTRANVQDALNLAEDESRIVHEASQVIDMLEAEGTAVAFHEVFQQVREDMTHVHLRLGAADVGKANQTLQEEVIDTLREMILALQKCRHRGASPPPVETGCAPRGVSPGGTGSRG